jgi:DNA repair protein RecO (recombination protein O)
LHTPEPALWVETNQFLDRLDTPGGPAPDALLAGVGLRMLAAIGWGLDLAGCVRCGKICEPGTGAYLDPGAGGLICRGCGGARILLRGDRRERLLAAGQGDDGALAGDDVRVVLEIVDAALEAHS